MHARALPEVLILAAGRGRRLRPLTDATPKALLPLGASTLIGHHLTRLRAQGFGDVVINLAWLGRQIRDALGDGGRFGLRIRYSDEPPGALNTGGGIVRALMLLRGGQFLVINADIVTDFNYANLRIKDGCAMQLVLAPNPPHHPHGDFGVRDGRLVMPAADAPALTYTGIGCFRRAAFAGCAPGRFALRPVLQRALTDGLAGAEVHLGAWRDAGTFTELRQARREMESPGRRG
ncbi:MAG: nucleotidyltransferase family protein [Gammaproteobacteria bacterium]